MGAVDFDAVEPDRPGVRCGVGEGADDLEDVLFVQFFRRFPVLAEGGVDDRRRSEPGDFRIRLHAPLPHAAHVPQLGNDRGPRRVRRLDDRLPPVQSVVSVHPGHRGVAARTRVVDHRPLGDDQPDAALGTPAVVITNLRRGHALRASAARHRGHDDPVPQRGRPEPERSEQRLGVDLHTANYRSFDDRCQGLPRCQWQADVTVPQDHLV